MPSLIRSCASIRRHRENRDFIKRMSQGIFASGAALTVIWVGVPLYALMEEEQVEIPKQQIEEVAEDNVLRPNVPLAGPTVRPPTVKTQKVADLVQAELDARDKRIDELEVQLESCRRYR
jgi:hypothetical protein